MVNSGSALEVVAGGNNAGESSIDIVFVHGLNPWSRDQHATKTWTHDDGTLWPRDLLPQQIPEARVMIYGYNSNVAADASEAGITQHADDLLDLLGLKRQDASAGRSLIFICHSLGGLLVKRAVLSASLNRRYRDIRQSIKGIIFFGTPHRGGNGATLGQIAVNTARFFTGSDQNNLVKALRKNSEFLVQLTTDFKHCLEDFNYLTVVESRGKFKIAPRTVVVDRDSAILGLPGSREHVIDIDCDHAQMCKFTAGAVFDRVARHIQRLASLAKEEAATMKLIADHASGTRIEPKHDDTILPVQAVRKVSMTSAMESTRLIGRDRLRAQIDQWIGSEAPCLVLHGEPGSGKTSVALAVAQTQQDLRSVFWFSAMDMDSLQDSYNEASRTVDPDHYTEYSRDHYQVVMDWLCNSANGNWLVIFDNSTPGLPFDRILPPALPWGKVLLTSRTSKLRALPPTLTHQMMMIELPYLSTNEALELFVLNCTHLHPLQSQTAEALTIASHLRHNVQAVLLASTYFQTFRSFPRLQQSPLRDTVDISSFNKGVIILLFEDARENERLLLMCLSLCQGHITLQMLQHWQTARGRYRQLQIATEFLKPGSSTSATNHWLAKALMKRLISTSGTTLLLPQDVQETLLEHLMHDRESTVELLQALLLLSATPSSKNASTTIAEIAKRVERSSPTVRRLCIMSSSISATIQVDVQKYLWELACHNIFKAIDEGRRLYKKLFWRRWLSSQHYAPPAYASNSHEEVPDVPEAQYPALLDAYPDTSDEREDEFRTVLCEYLVEELWNTLKSTLLVSGMANAWHSIREQVFEFVRSNFHQDFSEPQRASFIDFVDKGGAEGLQSLLLTIVNRPSFYEEVTERLRSVVADDLSSMTSALLSSLDSELPDDLIQNAVREACDGLLSETFTEVCGAMAGVLQPIVVLITSVLKGALEVPSDGENVRSVVSFVISECGKDHLLQRCLTIAQGFGEFLETARLWLAGKVCLSLTITSFDLDHADPQYDWRQILATIEVLREGVMSTERLQGRMGQVAVRRMFHWLEEACNCRHAWGARPDCESYEFRNQEMWEEFRCLIGAVEYSWILS